MFDVIQFSAAGARIRAELGRSVTDRTWEKLLSVTNRTDFYQALMETPYSEIVNEQSPSIEEFEKSLKEITARRFLAARPFLQGGAADLLELRWSPFEIDNLIIIIRSIHNRVSVERFFPALTELGANSMLDWKHLSNSTSIGELAERLQKTVRGKFYARAIDNALSEYERRNTVYVIEVALYLHYYRQLRHAIDKLPASTQTDAERYIGSRIDTRNLLWAYRYSEFFDFSPETIMGYTLPGSGRVDAALIRRAASGTPPFELVRDIWDDEIPDMHLIQQDDVQESLVNLELVFQRYLFQLANQALGGNPLKPRLMFAYLILLESEMQDLITTVEGIENEVPTEMIRENLIRKIGRDTS